MIFKLILLFVFLYTIYTEYHAYFIRSHGYTQTGLFRVKHLLAWVLLLSMHLISMKLSSTDNIIVGILSVVTGILMVIRISYIIGPIFIGYLIWSNKRYIDKNK